MTGKKKETPKEEEFRIPTLDELAQIAESMDEATLDDLTTPTEPVRVPMKSIGKYVELLIPPWGIIQSIVKASRKDEELSNALIISKTLVKPKLSMGQIKNLMPGFVVEYIKTINDLAGLSDEARNAMENLQEEKDSDSG